LAQLKLTLQKPMTNNPRVSPTGAVLLKTPLAQILPLSPLEPLEGLKSAIIGCRQCPRLVAWREEVAQVKKAAYQDQEYWGKPVPGFGDPLAGLVLIGLAPGAHGSNRTGRMFTGDSSGNFLYPALHRAGFANGGQSSSLEDGLELTDCFITAPVRCVPPQNKPTPLELKTCSGWFKSELELLDQRRVTLTLGRIGHEAFLRFLSLNPRDYPFSHGAEFDLPDGTTLISSYHVSRQNTQTGRLTPEMFDALLERVRVLLASPHSSPH
jgi:uracil-DNA glycosylase